jgi:hypothetical protein
VSIEKHLMDKFGPLLDTKDLVEVLNFQTADALIRSHQRGHLNLKLTELPHRRGLFALAQEVSKYLVMNTLTPSQRSK